MTLDRDSRGAYRSDGILLALAEWPGLTSDKHVTAPDWITDYVKQAGVRRSWSGMGFIVLQSLLLTALGGVLGAGGALLASRSQALEARRIRKEQNTREDRYRLVQERIKAYSSFFVAAGSARMVITGHPTPTPQEVIKARNDLWEAYTLSALVGDDDTSSCANALLELVSAIAYRGSPYKADQWDKLIVAFVQAARRELIPAPQPDF